MAASPDLPLPFAAFKNTPPHSRKQPRKDRTMTDKIALITGASRGLGAAMTEQLAALFDNDPRARARVMGIKRAS